MVCAVYRGIGDVDGCMMWEEFFMLLVFGEGAFRRVLKDCGLVWM